MNLISILMGIGVGAILMVSVTQWAFISKQTFQQHQNQMHFLDAGQTAIHYFLRDIQAAGYRGSRSMDISFPINKLYSDWNKEFDYFSDDKTVFGFFASPGACYRKMPHSACKRMKENSPVLIVYQVPQKINPLLTFMKRADEPLILKPQHGIRKGSMVLISDGYQGDLFIANRIQGSMVFHEKRIGLNKSECFSKAYRENAEVVELQTVAYYLGIPERFENVQYRNSNKNTSMNMNRNKNKNMNKDNEIHYSLFRDDFLQNAQEIITGVSHVEFEYALQNKEEGSISYYHSENIPDHQWPLVQSVRIHLTLENQQKWDFEVALRNRIFPDIHFGSIDAEFLACHTYGNTKHASSYKGKFFFK